MPFVERTAEELAEALADWQERQFTEEQPELLDKVLMGCDCPPGTPPHKQTWTGREIIQGLRDYDPGLLTALVLPAVQYAKLMDIDPLDVVNGTHQPGGEI